MSADLEHAKERQHKVSNHRSSAPYHINLFLEIEKEKTKEIITFVSLPDNP